MYLVNEKESSVSYSKFRNLNVPEKIII